MADADDEEYGNRIQRAPTFERERRFSAAVRHAYEDPMKPSPKEKRTSNAWVGMEQQMFGEGGVEFQAEKQRAQSGILKCVRQELSKVEDLMGKVHRNPITGICGMRNIRNFPDFYVVDLWCRQELPDKLVELQADPYLFKPVPLTYRTWFYHYIFNTGKVMPGIGEASSIGWCLSHPCIDAPISAGRWSPFACFAPLLLGTTLTGDLTLVFVAIAMVLILYFIQGFVNDPWHYRYTRLYSIPLRIGVFVFFLLRFNSADALSLAGSLCIIFTSIADFVGGEVSMVWNYKYNCTYDILKILPNRVCVCRRQGATEIEKIVGPSGQVDECVSGFGSWDRSHALVTDIKGLLVELKPMQREDWRSMHEDYCSKLLPLPYVRLECFGFSEEETPLWDHQDAGKMSQKHVNEALSGTVNSESRPAAFGTRKFVSGADKAVLSADSHETAQDLDKTRRLMLENRGHDAGRPAQRQDGPKKGSDELRLEDV